MLSNTKEIPKYLLENNDIVSSLNNSLLLKNKENIRLNKIINLLEEKNRYLENKIFGRKSEKDSKEENILQLSLFNEVEHISDVEHSEEDDSPKDDTKTKKRGGRKPIPDSFPREEKLHDITLAEKTCCGVVREQIGEEVSEQVKYIPATIKVIKHIRPKYGPCKICDSIDSKSVIIAPVPKTILPKTIASASLLAQIIYSKFVNHLPLYRQENIFERMGIFISRSKMSYWLLLLGKSFEVLTDYLMEDLSTYNYLGIDETRVQVLKEKDRSDTTMSNMWVIRGGPPEKPILIYDYHPTKSGKVALELIGNFKGYVQSDNFSSYDVLKSKPDIIQLGCWSHARRKFKDVVTAAGKKSKNQKLGKAGIGLSFIKKLYGLEKHCQSQNMSADQIYQIRQEKAVPIMDEFKKWLDDINPTVTPTGYLGKAISYTLKNWPKLKVYTTDGRLRIDNNLVEGAIRPFALGRKNWLFSGCPSGANASAKFYSLIETAKANKLDPYSYLLLLMEKLPFAETEEEKRSLLPMNVDQAFIDLALNPE